MLSAAFVGQGVNTFLNAGGAAQAVIPTLEGLQKVPNPVGPIVPRNPYVAARVNAAVQISGAILLAQGRIPRVASAMLAATVIPANLGNHMFWAEPDPVLKAQKRWGFLTDMSMLGGLMIASADTAGKPSLGWRGRRAAAAAIRTSPLVMEGSERVRRWGRR